MIIITDIIIKIIIAGITTTTIIFLSFAFLPFWRRCNSAVLAEGASVLWLFSYLFVTKTTAVYCHANLNSTQRYLCFLNFSNLVFLNLYVQVDSTRTGLGIVPFHYNWLIASWFSVNSFSQHFGKLSIWSKQCQQY